MADELKPAAAESPPAPGEARSDESVAPGPGEDTPDLQSRLSAAEQRAQTATQEAEAAKRYVVQLVTQLQQVAQQQNGGPEKEAERLREQFEQNPQAALDQAFAQRMAPVLQEQVGLLAQTQRRLTEERIRSADTETQREWQEFRPEVEKFMAEMPLDVQAKDGAWESAFNLIRAQHLDQIFQRRNTARVEQEKRTALEGASPARSGRGQSATFTPEERRMMGVFNMTEADWLKHRTELDQQQSGGR